MVTWHILCSIPVTPKQKLRKGIHTHVRTHMHIHTHTRIYISTIICMTTDWGNLRNVWKSKHCVCFNVNGMSLSCSSLELPPDPPWQNVIVLQTKFSKQDRGVNHTYLTYDRNKKEHCTFYYTFDKTAGLQNNKEEESFWHTSHRLFSNLLRYDITGQT